MKALLTLCLASMIVTASAWALGTQTPTAAPDAGIDVKRSLTFSKTAQKELSLDLYLPEKHAGKLPVVVLIYGGAWMGRFPQGQVGKARWLAGNGYAVAVIDYRLSSEAIFPAQIFDCKAAVRWIRAHAAEYDLDSAHIAAMGDSSGGHLACLLGVTAGNKELEGDGGNAAESSAVQAVVDLFGPTDITQVGAQAPANAALTHDGAQSPEGRLVGGAIADHLKEAKAASPVTYASKSSAPFLILHGDKDNVVPCYQSQLLYEALSKAGADVTYYLIAGAGHEGPQFNSQTARGAILAFLDQHLKKG